MSCKNHQCYAIAECQFCTIDRLRKQIRVYEAGILFGVELLEMGRAEDSMYHMKGLLMLRKGGRDARDASDVEE